MNLENFADYLKYPSRLYQLPYEELKSLTLQYPYCGNFHVLLLIKSKLEGHPDLEKNLAKVATYSIDRKFLRKLMQEDQLLPVASQFSIGEDEVLELKDLFSLEPELEKITLELDHTASTEGDLSTFYFDQYEAENPEEDLQLPSEARTDGDSSGAGYFQQSPDESFAEPEIPVAEELPVIPEDVVDVSDSGIPDAAAEPGAFAPEPELIALLSTSMGITQYFEVSLSTPPAPPPSTPAQVADEPFQVSPSIVANVVAAGQVLDSWWERLEKVKTVEWEITKPQSKTETLPKPVPIPRIQIAPMPKSKFNSYQKRYQHPPVRIEPVLPPEPKDTEPLEARQVARASVREDLEIASETLAGLLVQQQQYDRAIKMYEHLSLLIPEKNTYFAAKIDAIKNL